MIINYLHLNFNVKVTVYNTCLVPAHAGILRLGVAPDVLLV